MINKILSEAKERIFRKFDKAGNYTSLDEETARYIVSNVLDSYINDENRKENIINETKIHATNS